MLDREHEVADAALVAVAEFEKFFRRSVIQAARRRGVVSMLSASVTTKPPPTEK